MAFELVYTSAPAGLARGSSGFCVVACTQGLGPRLMVTLEGLSAYKPLYPHYAPNAWDNPISRSHYLYQANGEMQHILSRTCFNGVDHTQRSNKLASHLVLSEAEAGVAQGGPSSLLLQEELFKDANWEIKAEYFPTQRSIPRTYASYAKCTTWESVMGDAGWGGYLAQLYLDSPNRNVYIAYNPGQDNIILTLLHEALSLLPEQLRWQVTFNTYFVNLPAGMSCSWRCCPIDSDALRMAKRSPVNVVIDITRPQALNSDSELITLARTGVKDEPADEQPQEVTEEIPVLTNDVSETSEVVRLSVANTQSIVNNPPVNLNVISANDPRNVQFDYRNPGVTQARSKRGFLITCLVLLAVAIAAGAFYMVTNIQEKQLYDEQRAIFRQRMEVFNDYKERRSAADQQQANLKTQENVENLIYEVSDLLKLVESIQAEVEKLKEHQQLFEAYIDYNDLASSNDTPKTLINACEQEKKYLIKYLAKLNDIKQEIIQRNERIARQMQKKAKPVAAVPVTPAPVVPKAEPKKTRKKVAAKPKKAAPKVKSVKSNICYLWEKSADLHKLPQNGKIEIPVGDAARNDLLFAILPNNTFTRTGENIECDPNEFDQKATLGTDFATGKAIITLKSAILFPAIHEVLMRVKGKDYPLFFRLDVSKIKFSGKKNPENLQSEVKDCKLVVKIPKKILRMPANYFDANNQLCTVNPEFGLQIQESFHPFKTAGAFHVIAIEVPKLKNVISALKELEQIEKKIEQSPEKYIGELPTSIEQKKQYKELKIKLGRLEKEREAKEKIVNNKDTLNSIAKLLKSDKKTPAELKAAFDNYKGKSKDKHKKWSAAVDELQQIIVERDDSKNALLKLRQELTHMMKDKIALKDFASKKYTRTLVVEKKNAQEELKKLEEQLKQQVSNGMLQLQYAGKQYDQLEVKEIIQ